MEFPSQRFKDNANLSTGYLFIKVYNQWHSAIKDGLKHLEITHPQFVALTVLNYLLQENQYVSQTKIASQADMDVMTCSQILRGLEKKGYIKRIAHPEDPRANAVELLPKGQETVKRALPIVEQIDEELFGALQAKEKDFRNHLAFLTQQPQIKKSR